jgi:hypothetical protein
MSQHLPEQPFGRHLTRIDRDCVRLEVTRVAPPVSLRQCPPGDLLYLDDGILRDSRQIRYAYSVHGGGPIGAIDADGALTDTVYDSHTGVFILR